MTSYLVFLAGCLAGLVHASLLWRASHQVSTWSPLLGVLRLALVAGVLVAAAMHDRILPAAGGWALSFAAAGIGLWARLDRDALTNRSETAD